MSLILVVDDEPHIRSLVERILTLEGHKVLQAGSGEAVVNLCQQRRFDLVITDLMMPIMNGFDLIPILRQSHSYLPIVLMSGHPTREVVEFVGLLGAVAVVEKPFEPEQLVALVRSILRRKRP